MCQFVFVRIYFKYAVIWYNMPMSYGRLNKNDHNFPWGVQWLDRMRRRAIDTDLGPLSKAQPGQFFNARTNGIFSIEKILYSFIVLSIIFSMVEISSGMPCRRRGAWANLSHRVIAFHWLLLSPLCPPPIQRGQVFNCSLNYCRNCHATTSLSAMLYPQIFV